MSDRYSENNYLNGHDDASETDSWRENGKLISNRYRLGQVLGRGSFGQVFYTEDLKFDPPRIVALKLISSQITDDAGVREELKREASALARFNHPNILRVLDYEVSDGLSYIVTEYAAGGSLQRRLQPDPTQPMRPLDLNVVTRYLDQLSDALDQAHAQGIIHRDIKPQNILLDAQGRPMLADFGLSAAASSSTSSMIDTTPTGTPLYMAPEQWQGQVSKASDIYSLGVVLFQMLTGQTPYKGNPAALAWQHCNAPVPNVLSFAPWLAQYPHLEAVLTMALAKDAHQRPHSARELYNRFMDALQGNPASDDTLNVKLPMQQPVAPQPMLPQMQHPVMGQASWPQMQQPIAPQSGWPPVQPQWGQQGISDSQYSFAPSSYVRPDAVVRPKSIRLRLVLAALCAGVVVTVAAVLIISAPKIAAPPIVASQASTATAQPTNTFKATSTVTVQPTNTPKPTSGSIFQPISAATPTPKPSVVPTGVGVPVVTGTVGVTLTLPSKPNNFELTVTEVKTADTLENEPAAPGYHYLFLNVTYKSGTGEQFFFSKDNAKWLIRDSQNFAYTYDDFSDYDGTTTKTQALHRFTDDMQPGQRVSGWLTYEVPKTATGLVFEYDVQPSFHGMGQVIGIFQVGLDSTANYQFPAVPVVANAVSSDSGKIGDTIDGGDYYLTVTKTETNTSIQRPDGSTSQADAGNQFVAVNIIVESKSNDDVEINTNDFDIVDDQSIRHEVGYDQKPELETVLSLPAGEKLQGWLTFQIPTTAKNLVLEFKPTNDKKTVKVVIN